MLFFCCLKGKIDRQRVTARFYKYKIFFVEPASDQWVDDSKIVSGTLSFTQYLLRLTSLFPGAKISPVNLYRTIVQYFGLSHKFHRRFLPCPFKSNSFSRSNAMLFRTP